MKKDYLRRRFINFHKYKMSFVFIPKAGTTSIVKMILKKDYDNICGNIDKLDFFKIWKLSKERDVYNKLYSTTPPDNYDVFCFVRNPFSRVYSSFRNFSGTKKGMLKGYNNFSVFLRKNLNYDYHKNWHFFPMKYFINYAPSRTKIYRFEEFYYRMKKIMNNEEISHENKYKYKSNYIEQYKKEDKKIIEEIYSWDIKYLNYSFESYGRIKGIDYLKNNLGQYEKFY